MVTLGALRLLGLLSGSSTFVEYQSTFASVGCFHVELKLKIWEDLTSSDREVAESCVIVCMCLPFSFRYKRVGIIGAIMVVHSMARQRYVMTKEV